MDSKYIQYFKIIGQINDIINSSKSIEEVLNNVLKSITESLNVKYATIWFKDDNNVLHPYYSICPNDISEKAYLPGEGIVGKVFQEGKNVALIDFEKNKDDEVSNLYKGINIVSYICAPIENRNGVVGAIEVINDNDKFNEEEENILEMITTIATMKIEDSDTICYSHTTFEPFLWIREYVVSGFTNENSIYDFQDIALLSIRILYFVKIIIPTTKNIYFRWFLQ